MATLFDLVAKLTLDSSEYKSALSSAESDGQSVDDIEVNLGLDKTEFDKGIADAEGTDVSDPDDPDLGLDKTDFDSTVSDAEETDVADPDEPSLGLDTSEFSQSLDDAQSDAEEFDVNIKDIIADISTAMAAYGIAAAVKTVVDNLAEAVNLAAKLGDDVDKGSRRLNISTDAYQEWSHALSQSGANIDSLSRGILNMNKYITGAKVSEDVSGAFEQLGLNAKIANGEITTTEGLLTETVKALADFRGDSEQRGVLATAIFGRSGSVLNALFDSGSQGIQDLIDEAHELGLVMTGEEIADSVAYGDAVANLQSAVDALKTSFATDILPNLTEAVEMVTKIVAFFNQRTGSNTLSGMFAETDENAAEALADIEATSTVASTLADKLIAMGDASKLTAEQQAVWKGTAEELVKLIPSLSEVIDLDTLTIKGNSDEIGQNIKQWENLARQRALAQAKEEKQRAIIEKNKDAIEAQIAINRKAGEVEAARIKSIERINKTLEKYGRTERLSEDASLQDIWNLRQGIGFGRDVNTQRLQKELSSEYDAYAEQTKQLENLETELEGYRTELEEAQSEYEEWAAAAEEIFGTAEDSATNATDAVDALNQALNGLPSNKTVSIRVLGGHVGGETLLPFAKGNWNVPYDMPAMVHRGETILTSSEAREYRENTSSGVDINGLVPMIAGAIRQGMQDVVVRSYLSGKDVTDDVSQNTVRAIKARRFKK